MKQKKKFDRAVGETTHAAGDLGKEALALAGAYLQQAQDYLAPRAQDAYQQAADRIAPFAKDARKKSAKFAAQRLDHVRPQIDEALDRITPALDDAYARIAPAVDNARSKVQKEFLPGISELLHSAADDLAKVELPEVPAPRKHKKHPVLGTIMKVVLAGGLLAAIVVAVRKFLEPTDSGWQAHEPSQPYVPTSTQTIVEDLTVTTPADAADDYLDAPAAPTVDGVEETDASQANKSDGDTEGDAAPFARSPHGEGSYVGDNPPQGFTIKGNERSMKYHVPGNGGYERTIADVWFDSEKAAEAAGFTKAQR